MRRAALFLLLLAAHGTTGGAQAVSARDSTGAAVTLRAPARSALVLDAGAAEALRAVSGSILISGQAASGATDIIVVGNDRRLAGVGADTPVFVYSPRNFLELADAFMALGILSGEESRGIKLAAQMSSAVKQVRSIIGRLPSASFPRVFIQEEESPLATCGASSFLNALVSEAGGRVIVDRKEVARRAPDIIIVSRASGARSGESWGDTPAGGSGKVFVLDLSAGISPGPRSATLLLKVARLLHPDLIP